jgi:ABC-type multidrug transport system fused ATPase/permease subunit
MTTGVIAVIIMNIATMTAALFLAFYYNWRLALIVIFTSPLLVIAGSINMTRMKQFAQQADSAYR